MSSSIDSLALGRSKRSTAGNRMRELLERAHTLEEEEGFEEVADDVEFDKPVEEEDIFEEDFESTDDERVADEEEDEEAYEKRLEKEERAANRAQKQKGKHYHNPLAAVKRPTKPAIRPSTSGTTAGLAASHPDEPSRKKRRVSVILPGEQVSSPATPADDIDMDEDGDESRSRSFSMSASVDDREEGESMIGPNGKKLRRWEKPRKGNEARRSTMRASTLKNQIDVDVRLKEEKERNKHHYRPRHSLSAPKLTQADLIAQALETEEANIETLKIWLEQEEERKRLGKVVRKVVAGPRVTWISRRVEPLAPGSGSAGTSGVNGKLIEVNETKKKRDRKGKGKEVDPSVTTATDLEDNALTAGPSTSPSKSPSAQLGVSPAPAVKGPSPAATPLSSSTSALLPPVPQVSITSTLPVVTQTPTPALPAATVALPAPAPTPILPPYERNYVILSSIPGGQAAELKTLFGDHGEWTAMPRIPGRNRPVARRPDICPFTGFPARYLHPATKVPYATKEGFKAINEMLAHDYLWSEERRAFLSRVDDDEKADGMEGVEGWEEAVRGWWSPEEEVVEDEEEGEGEGDETGEGEEVEEEEEEEVIEEEVPIVVQPPVKKGKKKQAEKKQTTQKKKK